MLLGRALSVQESHPLSPEPLPVKTEWGARGGLHYWRLLVFVVSVET